MKKFIAVVSLVCAACGGEGDGESGVTLADKVRVTLVGRNGRTVDVPEVQTDSDGNLVIQGTQGEPGAPGVAGPQGPAVAHLGYVDASGVEVTALTFMAPMTVMYDKEQTVFFVVDPITGAIGGNPDKQSTFFTSSDCSGERLGRWDVRNLAFEVDGTLYQQGNPMSVEQAKSLECFTLARGTCAPCSSALRAVTTLEPVKAPRALIAQFPVSMAVVQ